MKQTLVGTSVLVTRPTPAATRFARLIRGHGGSPICQPGVELVAVTDAEPSLACLAQLADEDIVVFTSPNAVQFALQRKPASDWPAKTVMIAVGQRTAETLAAGGLDAVLAPVAGADSESVLQLPLLQQLVDRKVLIACAPGGRQLLNRELTARGARVQPVFLYHRVPPKADPRVLAEIKLAIDRLVATVTSVRILENITSLLGTELLKRPLCVISNRIEERAQQLGYEQIHVAREPGDQALLAAVFHASQES